MPLASKDASETHALRVIAAMPERIPTPIAQGGDHAGRSQAIWREPPGRVGEGGGCDEHKPANKCKTSQRGSRREGDLPA